MCWRYRFHSHIDKIRGLYWSYHYCVHITFIYCMVKNKNLRLANVSIGSKLTILLLNVDGVIKPDSLASYKKLYC